MVSPSFKVEIQIIIFVLQPQDALAVVALMQEIGFLLVSSGEKQILPEAVVRRFDAAFGMPGFLLFKIPAGGLTSMELIGIGKCLGPNCDCKTII